MSAYILSSPIDIQSNTAASAGTINIFNGATNSTSLRAPTILTANRPFILPSATGVVGSYIKYDGTNVIFGSGVTNTTTLPVNLEVCNTNVSNAASTTSTTFTTVGTINWRGTATEGTPSAVYAIISAATATGEVRLFNRTAATTAALAAFGITAGQIILPVPITGGFTAGADIIDVQIRRTGIIAANVNLFWIQIVP